MKNKYTPEIRFLGFTEDWEQRKLGELIEISSAARVHKNEWTTSGVRFFRSSDVVSNFYGKKNIPAFISSSLYNKLSKKSGLVQPGDILVTGGGSIGIPYLVADQEPLYFKDADLIWLKSANIIDGYFLYFYFVTDQLRKYISNITHIGTISHYTIEQSKETPIILPERVEQTLIGNFFKQMDDIIALHQQELKTLKQTKQGFLQKMFPKEGESVPEVRFPGFTEVWKECDLGNAVEFYSGLTYSPDNITEKGTLVLRSSNIQNGEIVDADNVYVNPKFVNSQNIEVGDVIVVVRNGSRNLIGKHASVKKKVENTVIGAFMTGIRAEIPSFINVLLDSNQFSIEINKNLGATINQITTGNFKKMKFFFPANEEQEKIGNFFEQLDETIALQQQELDALKETKKAFLQKMFV